MGRGKLMSSETERITYEVMGRYNFGRIEERSSGAYFQQLENLHHKATDPHFTNTGSAELEKPRRDIPH